MSVFTRLTLSDGSARLKLVHGALRVSGLMTHLLSGLVITMGVLASCVGLASAVARLQDASRAHRRIETLYDAMPEGWSSWFLGGFSGLSLGSRWLRAAAALIGWTLAGLSLIGLGLRLVWPH